ncbi:tetratricopeptide repeat protein [Streptomyces sp. NPDC085596]|uniref:tetratricopeptide repeat protein n=1 Tax=Streptomyces sp. NPDC085596 TaxID=3365731 RepID=UPI0037D359BB
MERRRLAGVTGPGGPGSGYAVGGRLVLTSAHVAGTAGSRVKVFHPGGEGSADGAVLWCGTPGGRDDAALVLVDDGPRWQPPTGPVRWGRLVTSRPGTGCETWGVPDVAQRPRLAVEAEQLQGRVNPGSGFVGNQYVMDLLQHPPQWSSDSTSPWGGLSGAAMLCDRLLTGVIASDRAHSGHARLNVVPGYVLHHDPGFRCALVQYGAGEDHELEAVEFQHLTDHTPAVGSGVLASPAALLEARHQVVPFHGRTVLLEELQAWCALGGFGAWLLHGPGGQGKTRLAHHLAHLLAPKQWAVLWPDTDATTDRLQEVRHATTPLLVVLDYAENRTGQLTALLKAAADHPGSSPLKLLLLGRTGDWWREAATATRLSGDLLAMAPTRLLTELEDDPARRVDAYHDAARAFAVALPEVRNLPKHDWSAAAAELTAPRLEQHAYGNALTLHMTALADLLDTTTPGHASAAQEASNVEDRLLDHERRHWRHNAAALGLTPDLSHATLETALAAAHLTSVPDRDQADVLWQRLPALADQPRDRRDRVTNWLTKLYPAAGTFAAPWGALQPDRIAERHIGHTLTADPFLADHLLNGADPAQREQLLTVYSRAAAHSVFGYRLDTQLTELCTRRYPELSEQIINTATKTDHPTPLTTALDTTACDPAVPLNDLLALSNQFPQASRRLATAAAHLAQALVERHRLLTGTDPDVHRADLAMSLNNLSVRLGAVGRREEGLTAIQEAVGHYRVLAEPNPDVYLPDLAMSLNNFAVDLGAVGRREEGLTAIQEAVAIRRALAEANPDVYLADLAVSLNNLSIGLGEVGRREEGLTAVQEAVHHHRALAEANPATHLPDLAASLNNLSIGLGGVGRREESLTAIQEAIGIRRALAEANPDTHLPDLAMSLNNLSVQLGALRRREEALTVIQEAVGVRRALAEANPDAYLPALAMSLSNLSVRLGAVGRQQESLTAIQEAIGIRRALAKANPDAYLPNLAASLNNLSVRLGELGHQQESLTAIQEAIDHYGALAATNPAAFGTDLQRCLKVAAWLETLGP